MKICVVLAWLRRSFFVLLGAFLAIALLSLCFYAAAAHQHDFDVAREPGSGYPLGLAAVE